MELQVYLSTVAAQLVNELKPILTIKGVTSNTDLLGKYTEAAIRSLVKRIVHPMRVCTGAVLDYPIPVPLRQIDLIIWAPFPAPAIFETEDFGLVPKSSAFGVIEIKRSNYSAVNKELQGFFDDVAAAKIVAEHSGPFQEFKRFPGIGIISVLESAPTAKLKSFLQEDKVVGIFQRVGDVIEVRPRDVLVLINFLHYVTWRYRLQSAQPSFPQINTEAF